VSPSASGKGNKIKDPPLCLLLLSLPQKTQTKVKEKKESKRKRIFTHFLCFLWIASFPAL